MEGIKIIQPESFPYDMLKSMFSLQYGLLDKWVALGKVPNYPASINSKDGQSFLKSVISNGVEEMSEAHEIFRLISEKADNNDLEGILNKQYCLAEETADYLHFFLEAMIYLNINAEDINAYYLRLIQELGGLADHALEEPTLEMSLIVASMLMSQEYDASILRTSFDLGDNGGDIFYKGSNRAGMDLTMVQATLMWDVTYQFMLAMNHLKNRPWKLSDEKTDTDKLAEQMMLGWLALMNLLSYMGHDAQSIYSVYYHKNQINHQRIAAKR